jgi:hypothetical protein
MAELLRARPWRSMHYERTAERNPLIEIGHFLEHKCFRKFGSLINAAKDPKRKGPLLEAFRKTRRWPGIWKLESLWRSELL